MTTTGPISHLLLFFKSKHKRNKRKFINLPVPPIYCPSTLTKWAIYILLSLYSFYWVKFSRVLHQTQWLRKLWKYNGNFCRVENKRKENRMEHNNITSTMWEWQPTCIIIPTDLYNNSNLKPTTIQIRVNGMTMWE